MKRKIIGLLAGILLAAIIYGIREYFRGHTDVTGEPAITQLTANALIKAFEDDSLQSTRLYVGKVVAVKGRIVHLEADENPVVITLGEEGQLSSVQCSMDSAHVAAYRKLATGHRVNLKGICTGAISQDVFGTDVKLSRCVIDENHR